LVRARQGSAGEEAEMKRSLIGVVATLALVTGGLTASLQRVEAGGQQAQHKPQAQHQEPEREIFCSHLSAGQLCLGGTPNVLKLDGAAKQRWTDAARRYNQAVDAATKQLLADAKTTLTPEQYATLQKWFDKGVNELLNQLLVGSQH
jgi:hypothetical protein